MGPSNKNKKKEYLSLKNKVVIKDGYEEIYLPSHPRAHKDGMVYKHILIAEEKLGRPLFRKECVHHIDHDRRNNHPDNLMIFATNRDHSIFHSAEKNNLKYSLVNEDGVFKCIIYKDTKQGIICPKCGCRKSKGAILCLNCRNSMSRCTKKMQISKKQLVILLTKYSYTEIGKMYGVSDNAVIKLAKKYNIWKPCYKKCPDVNELINQLRIGNRVTASKYFKVSLNTIDTWIRNNNIVIIPQKYKCIETGEIFLFCKDAARVKYPTQNINSTSIYIKRACLSCKEYNNFHWSIEEKQVCIDLVG